MKAVRSSRAMIFFDGQCSLTPPLVISQPVAAKAISEPRNFVSGRLSGKRRARPVDFNCNADRCPHPLGHATELSPARVRSAAPEEQTASRSPRDGSPSRPRDRRRGPPKAAFQGLTHDSREGIGQDLMTIRRQMDDCREIHQRAMFGCPLEVRRRVDKLEPKLIADRAQRSALHATLG